MAFSRTISYSSTYPTHYYDYLGNNDEDGSNQNRLAPVYEYLTENWETTLSYIYVQEAEEAMRTYIVTGVTYTPPAELIGTPTAWDYSVSGNSASITGTWSNVFQRNEFDFRMNNETVIENIDIEEVGYDETDLGTGAYAPVEYRPDERRAVEGYFTIKMDAYIQGSKVGTETDTVYQTVLNNWDANRRRLLEYRDNPLRGENIEAVSYGSTGNAGDVVLSESGEYELVEPNTNPDPITVEPEDVIAEFGAAEYGIAEYGEL